MHIYAKSTKKHDGRVGGFEGGTFSVVAEGAELCSGLAAK
jgi:hypothetical protein